MVVDDGYILVVGGENGKMVERCSIPLSSSSGIICRQQSPDLGNNYDRYPELFIVPQDYCKYYT